MTTILSYLHNLTVHMVERSLRMQEVPGLIPAPPNGFAKLSKGWQTALADKHLFHGCCLDCAGDGHVPYRLPHTLPAGMRKVIVVLGADDYLGDVVQLPGDALVEGAESELQSDYLRNARLQSRAAAVIHRIWARIL